MLVKAGSAVDAFIDKLVSIILVNFSVSPAAFAPIVAFFLARIVFVT